ncbi:hypothetical protein ABFX02_10G146800 [Erythranthe guttata]
MEKKLLMMFKLLFLFWGLLMVEFTEGKVAVKTRFIVTDCPRECPLLCRRLKFIQAGCESKTICHCRVIDPQKSESPSPEFPPEKPSFGGSTAEEH